MDEQRSPASPVSVVIADEAALPFGPPHLLDRQAGAEVVRQGEWVVRLTKSQAEDVLDWLQANGFPPCELACREDGFAVHCPGLRAYWDKGRRIRVVG
jgi:hypothetical protein